MKNTEIINRIKIKIAKQEVLRYLGYQKDVIYEINIDIKEIVRQEIVRIYPLLESKGIYQLLDIFSLSPEGIILTNRGHKFMVNKEIIDLLKNAEYLILSVVTIGPKIEKAVKEKFRQNQYIRAMVLDAAGTVAVKNCWPMAQSLY